MHMEGSASEKAEHCELVCQHCVDCCGACSPSAARIRFAARSNEAREFWVPAASPTAYILQMLTSTGCSPPTAWRPHGSCLGTAPSQLRASRGLGPLSVCCPDSYTNVDSSEMWVEALADLTVPLVDRWGCSLGWPAGGSEKGWEACSSSYSWDATLPMLQTAALPAARGSSGSPQCCLAFSSSSTLPAPSPAWAEVSSPQAVDMGAGAAFFELLFLMAGRGPVKRAEEEQQQQQDRRLRRRVMPTTLPFSIDCGQLCNGTG